MVMCFNRRITHCSFIPHLKDANTPDMLKDLERVAWLIMNYEYKISITELTMPLQIPCFFLETKVQSVRKISQQRGSASKFGVKRTLDFTAAEDEDFSVPFHNLYTYV